MKDRKTKTKTPALKVVHRNDRAQINRVLAGSGQALLPMLELLEGAKASIDELTHDSAVALVEQLLVLSAQQLAGTKQRGRAGSAVLWHGFLRGVGLVARSPAARAASAAERKARLRSPCAGVRPAARRRAHEQTRARHHGRSCLAAVCVSAQML
jgi:hypothetical protein